MNDQLITATAQEIIGLYMQHGQEDYIGGAISQLEHMSQSAMLAQDEGYEEEVILAAFLHDIGYFCSPRRQNKGIPRYGLLHPEKEGADYLRAKGFSERLARLVEGHVQAKRYLTFKFPKYYDLLSPACKQTLQFQGGRMNEMEADNFERDELFSLCIRMRRWDELSRKENQPIVNLAVVKQMLIRHLHCQVGRKVMG